MAPPYKKHVTNPDSWWQMAYHYRPDIVAYFELKWHDEIIVPGTIVRIKNIGGTYKFRCLAHSVTADRTWFDCIDLKTGEWRSFRVEQIRCVVKPKRSRRKKTVSG